MKSKAEQYTRYIKEAALRHGFMGAGIARAEFMTEEARHLEEWLAKGYHGEMGYMANHFDLRTDPAKLVPGAKSVVSLMFNYYPDLPPDPLKDEMDPSPFEGGRGDDTVAPENSKNLSPPSKRRAEPVEVGAGGMKISRYAFGEDYHKVLRRKLKALVADLKNEIGDFHARVFVDSAPVLERDWAKRSGLGWIGRNTLLIHPKKGSYFFLAEIILDVELEYDVPIRDHCGTCTRCIDACPTDAISPEGYVLDGSKCISYLTIELKSAIPEEFRGQMEGWIFGCDICQEVCPWNRFSEPHTEPAFAPSADFSRMTDRDWVDMTEEVFEKNLGKTPLKRAGLEKLKETVRFVAKGEMMGRVME